MSKRFYIPFGQNEAHAARLKAGLESLPSGFNAKICFVCQGRGEFEQTYTAGCGGGYYRATGPCSYCSESGLLQGDGAAPRSVLEQVLNAAPARQEPA